MLVLLEVKNSHREKKWICSKLDFSCFHIFVYRNQIIFKLIFHRRAICLNCFNACKIFPRYFIFYFILFDFLLFLCVYFFYFYCVEKQRISTVVCYNILWVGMFLFWFWVVEAFRVAFSEVLEKTICGLLQQSTKPLLQLPIYPSICRIHFCMILNWRIGFPFHLQKSETNINGYIYVSIFLYEISMLSIYAVQLS